MTITYSFCPFWYLLMNQWRRIENKSRKKDTSEISNIVQMIDSFTESINIFYINTFNLFQIYLYFVTTGLLILLILKEYNMHILYHRIIYIYMQYALYFHFPSFTSTLWGFVLIFMKEWKYYIEMLFDFVLYLLNQPCPIMIYFACMQLVTLFL